MKNTPAVASVLLGLLGVAALPGAVTYAERSIDLELIWAGVAVPVAFVLGLGALAAAGAGRRRAELRLVGRSGSATARVGRLLGLLALVLAGTGAIALAVYAILSYQGRS
jgi:hypothetical protein